MKTKQSESLFEKMAELIRPTHPYRAVALEWWNKLSEEQKIKYYNEYLPCRLDCSSEELTGREIQNIWTVKPETVYD